MNDSDSTLTGQLRRAQIITIAAVLLLTTLIAAIALFKPEPRRSGTNSVPPSATIATLTPGSGPACVRQLDLPADTGGLRVTLGTNGKPGPQTTLTLRTADGKLLRRSTLAGFGDGRSPIFKFAALRTPLVGGSACFDLTTGAVAFAGDANGNLAPSVFWIGNRPAPGDLSIEYMRPGEHSVLSMLGTVIDRAALFRPDWMGPWTIYLAFLLAIAAIGAGVLLLLRLGRGLPFCRGTMAVLAAIVFVNALAWAVITPAFNVPDELAHFTYVETLAHGELPDKSVKHGEAGNSYLPSTVLASNYTAVTIIQNTHAREPWSKATETAFKKSYAEVLRGPNAAYGLTPANSYTPLYYAPAVVAYKLSPGDGVFGKLLAVRIYSALLVALTALLVVLFARELLPSVWWFAPVAGLAVAFEPMFVHVGGGASNDNLMVLLATATLYFLARMLRRGPTAWVAAGAGASFALGYIAKPTTLGLAPAVALTFLVAFLRSGDDRAGSLRKLALGVAAFAGVFLAGAIAFGPSGTTGAAINASGAAHPASAMGFLSYLWQWYLPRLPGMNDAFSGAPPVGGVYLRGFIANFNALDTYFASWVYVLIALVLAALVGGAGVAVYQRRAALRERWPLVAMPAVAVIGMLLFINFAAYLMYTTDGSLFAQGRYLFPVIGVFGALVAAGSLGAGRLRGLVVGSGVVLALAALNLLGMGLSIGRFYL